LELQQNEYVRYDDLPLETSDGRIVHVEFVSNVYLANNAKVIQCNIRDNTERKKIQDEIKFQADLINNVGQAVIATDLLGKVIYWNNAAESIYGWSATEAIGENIINLTPALQSNEQAIEIMKQLSAGKVWAGEFHVKRKNGSTFPAYVTDTPITDSKGNLTGIIGISIDNTERKHTEMELIEAKEKAEESDRLKTAFLHNISHEIRTPMNAIVGFSGFLCDPDLKTEKRKLFTDIIIKSSDQLLAIIDDIMCIASIEAGLEKIQETEMNINSVCKLISNQFFHKALEKSVTLSIKSALADNDANIVTDATKLTQVLSNLIGNALKFTQQGNVKFGYIAKDSLLEFYVEDTGIGIPLDMQDVIFTRFRQVETTKDQLFGGSGIGLSISKAYVELLGGKIWVNSELGKGSKFYFTIPYKKVNSIKSPKIPSTKGLGFEFEPNKTLLIAEDDDSNFMLLEILLSDTGINIIRAGNGMEAIEICKSNPNINLVLMDIKMPIMDGYKATKHIKEFRPHLPIIALTAYSTENDKNEALTSGCSDFISKPIKIDALLAKISEELTK
jgi:PAS domain S-box-containing protein